MGLFCEESEGLKIGGFIGSRARYLTSSLFVSFLYLVDLFLLFLSYSLSFILQCCLS